MMVRDRTPASRLASGLIPTDSINMPSAVLPRDQRGEREGTERDQDGHRQGRARSPTPIPAKVSLLTVVICPSVTSMASPRPAVISTRVAMMGWMPSAATRKPFHSPRATLAARARLHAMIAVLADPGWSAPTM